MQEGKEVFNLNVERIAELDAPGMVWKVRYGRPKKGDDRYRLRRNNNKTNNPTSNNDGNDEEERNNDEEEEEEAAK